MAWQRKRKKRRSKGGWTGGQMLKIAMGKKVEPGGHSANGINDTCIDSAEWLALMTEIKWPHPAQIPTTADVATDPAQCSCTVTNPDATHRVGDYVTVEVFTRDVKGRPKTYGGDFFQAKLYNTELKASTFGQVTDHRNGTYTIQLALLWAGTATVSVRLIHSSEAVHVLARQRDQDPDKVYFLGHFRGKGLEETVHCNAQKSARLIGDGNNCCCIFPDPLTEETWICRKPTKLPCSAWIEHSFGGYQARLSWLESSLLSRTAHKVKCLPGLDTPVPAGFFLQDKWMSLVCETQSFPSVEKVSACMKDKHILMMGDSTLRQWFEYLLQTVPTLKKLNFFTSHKSGPFEAVDVTRNILLEWRAHGLPLRTDKTPRADLHYIANELERLPGGEHTVVVFTIWAHFTTHPLSTYIRRLSSIRRAVVSLLRRSFSRTLVVIKSANTGYKDVYGSDWLSWQLDHVLRAMFRNLPVVILDVWQMTSCHYAPDNIHPPIVVVSNEVELFLSFVCPN
ncbi:NXPE family member 3-like [Alosa pseudoharengus]|uniref:NXPE family member 3-like n=1 Tax=Alosa pseudoharengus TaxID=34774 RepID=UPI003F8AF742